MSQRILIAYASGTGSTAEVAEAIADVLRQEATTVEVKSVTEMKTTAPYSAIVVGSSIRVGRWLPEAVAFVQQNQADLRTKPVAYFTTCLTMANRNADNRRTVLAYMDPVLKIDPDIQPVGLGLFAGALAPTQTMLMSSHTGPYGDFRNWDIIRDWAQKIRPMLLTGETPKDHKVTNLANAILSFTDLSGMNLSEVNLKQADLTAAELTNVNLTESQLNWANFSDSTLVGANLQRANLIGSVLHAADLTSANLSEAILNGANLSNTTLQGANLQEADLNWANLAEADLRDANLSQANLLWANLAAANLMGATLTDARYNIHTHWPDDFSPEAVGAVEVKQFGL